MNAIDTTLSATLQFLGTVARPDRQVTDDWAHEYGVRTRWSRSGRKVHVRGTGLDVDRFRMAMGLVGGAR